MAAKGTSGSYYDDYMRSNAMLKHGGDRNAKQLLTDRTAYISFLEVQLERVSAACLNSQTFEKRLGELEAAQLANDQKASSLSKVFRLNQEYMEQTSEQSRSELVAFASKMDSWMEKYSMQLAAHETRITQGEELLRRSDTFVEALNDQLQRELDGVKRTMESDVQELKTLSFAAETRLENLQQTQLGTEQQTDILHKVLAARLDEDLERIRTSLSEKYVAMEQKHEQLQESLHAFASEMELNAKAEFTRMTRTEDGQMRRLRDRVDRMEQDAVTATHEMKEILRKCLDAQHLLSATVVGLQAELDDKMFTGATATKDAARGEDTPRSMAEAMEELQANQHRLKDALRVVQSCTREAEQRTEAQCDRLVGRLDAAEQQFARMAHESLSKADEMRTKVLVALGDVEIKLRHDADAVAENAVLSVQSESKMYIAQFMEMKTSLEKRLDEMEDMMRKLETQTLHVTVPTNPTATSAFHTQGDTSAAIGVRESDVARLTDAVSRSVEEQLSSMLATLRVHPPTHQTAREGELEEQIRQLERRLDRNALQAEEQSALFPPPNDNPTSSSGGKRPSQQKQKPPLRMRSAASSSFSSSSSTAGSILKPKRASTTCSAPRANREVRPLAKKSMDGSTAAVATRPIGTAKANRLKELCLELVAMEGSMKNAGKKCPLKTN